MAILSKAIEPIRSLRSSRKKREEREEGIWAYVKSLAKEGNTKELLSKIEQIEQEFLIETQAIETLLNTALTTAISANKEETALALLEHGANPKLYDSLALRTSASQGLYKTMMKCLEKGADPCVSEGMILLLAVSHNQPEVVQTLLEFIKSKNIKLENLKIHRAIEMVCFNTKEPIANIIFSHMESKDIINSMKSMYNKTIRQCANKILVQRTKDKIKSYLQNEETTML